MLELRQGLEGVAELAASEVRCEEFVNVVSEATVGIAMWDPQRACGCIGPLPLPRLGEVAAQPA